MSIADIRREYLGQPLSETDSDPNPFRQFERWFAQVRELEPDATEMALATATRDGRPSIRTVLLKGLDDRGFVFYTNYNSRAGKVSAEESDAYFATRPLESRWSVYASRQSEVIDSREALESRFAIARQEYGDRVPRPAWWGGYRIVPEEFEFWQGRPSRLHDRLRYVKEASGAWRRERLAP